MRGPGSLSTRSATGTNDDRRSVVSAGSSNASTLVADSLASSTAASKQSDKSNLRKFTAGVGRPGLAREAREAARNVISTHNPTRKPPIAAPLDYEKFLVDKNVQMENDPQRELLVFPRDDIEETIMNVDSPTAVPAVLPTDVRDASWLLTKDALQMYSSPQKSVTFNYSKFSGDYNALHNASSADMDVALSSLVFESDMALEEIKAAEEGFILSTDVIKEGFLQVVKPDSGLLDNLKSEKKRRWCILRRLEGGTIAFEVQKTQGVPTGKPILRVNSAQLRATKKGRTVLEIEPCPSEDEKGDKGGGEKKIMLAPDANDAEELPQWLQIINRALALANKADHISVASGITDGDIAASLADGPRLKNESLSSALGGDTDSIHSEDSYGARDMQQWKGRTTAARALQPPIVDRRNLFSLYHRLAPVADPKYENVSIHPSRSETSNSSSPSGSPSLRRQRTNGSANGDKESAPSRLSVELVKLDMRLPVSPTEVRQIEPLFVKMFLFDAVAGSRLTEEFHVDVNDDELHAHLQMGRHPSKREEGHEGVPSHVVATTKARKMVCSVAAPSASTWIVIRVDRILSADLHGELYMRTTGDVKATLKLQRNLQAACARLGSYRTRFAFAARRVFPELQATPSQAPQQKASITTNGSSDGGGCLQLFRCEANRLADADLQKYLTDYAKFERTSKLLIPGASVTLNVDTTTKIFDFPVRLSSSFLPLAPWKKESKEPPVFELQSFCDVVSSPHSSLLNLLYVYPLALKYDNQKVFSKARNISCSVRFMRGGEDVAREAFLDRLNPKGPFCPSVTCCIQHHQQSPSFGDEMKLRLPLSLGQYDHLLFTFSHVSVMGQLNAKSPSESVESIVGYAWLPLATRNERLLMESDEADFALCVAAELPKGYYRYRPLGIARPDEPVCEVKWVDQKPLFRLRLRLISSVYTTQPRLQAYFQACQRLEQRGHALDDSKLLKRSPSLDESIPRSCSPIGEASLTLDDEHPLVREMTGRSEALVDVDISQLIPFLPLLLNRLLSTLTLSSTDALAHSTLSTIISLVDGVSRLGRSRLLRVFLRCQLNPREAATDEESLHSAICRHLPTLLRQLQSSPDELAVVYRQMSFLLEAAVKSMALIIIRKQLYKTTRMERFSSDFVDQISFFVDTLVPQMIAKHRTIVDETRIANTALAYFMRWCLSFMDRGAVFRWIHCIVSRLDQAESRGVLREYKADLLIVMARHEHWLPLSLPLLIDSSDCIQRIHYESTVLEANTASAGTGSGILARFFNQLFVSRPPTASSDIDRYARCVDEWWLSEGYARRHFPIGLILQELWMCVREPREYRKKPIALIRNLLAKHGYDKRYADINYQRRIAVLYAPLIRFAVENLAELESSLEGTGNTSTDSAIGVRASKWKGSALQMPNSGRLSMFPRNSIPSTAAPNASSAAYVPLAEKLDSEEVQDILLSVVFVLQRLPKKVAGALWQEGEGTRADQLLRLLEVILDVFKYRGKAASMAAVEHTNRIMQRASHVLNKPGPFPRWDELDAYSLCASSSPNSAPPFAVLQMLNLSQEVALIVLDSIQTFSEQLASRWCNGWSWRRCLFSRLLDLHLHLLSEWWPESVRLHALAALALFVNLFRQALLDTGPLDCLSTLIGTLLYVMSSRLSNVQLAAAALLQIILRAGYEQAAPAIQNEIMHSAAAKNGQNGQKKVAAIDWLGRPGAQTGVALACLLGRNTSLSGSGRVDKGLAALDSLVSSHDPKKQTYFDKAVLELTRQLRGVMAATGALNHAKNHPIRLADLHMHLADSYRGSAALRSTWLETLAQSHSSGRWYSEAAVCMTHSVAVCARELHKKGELGNPDWSVLDWVSKEIAPEEVVNGDERVGETIQPAEFTLDDLESKIEKAAHLLTQSERYEAIGPLYRLIIPALEKNARFNSLVSVYAELQQSYSRAAEARTSGKRHLGAYFRVRFYGKTHFDADHDTEWIYREQGLTSLAEISQRLGDHCRQVVGHDRVQVEPEKELDEKGLNEAIAYVQVTHVDPSCVEGETLSFATHTNLSEFVYEKAIIEGTKGDGEPAVTQRALRKTFLTVGGAFPSTRRRLKVIHRTEQTFSPLEFACQKLRIKASQMRCVVNTSCGGTRPFDIKGLQLLLQGAVMPTVNAGPLVYAEAFTQPEQKKRYGEEGIADLKKAFRELMSACGAALKANGAAIGHDQTTYHEVLMSSWHAMQERLSTFFGASFTDDEREKLEEGRRTNGDFPRNPIHIFDSISGVES